MLRPFFLSISNARNYFRIGVGSCKLGPWRARADTRVVFLVSVSADGVTSFACIGGYIYHRNVQRSGQKTKPLIIDYAVGGEF